MAERIVRGNAVDSNPSEPRDLARIIDRPGPHLRTRTVHTPHDQTRHELVVRRDQAGVVRPQERGKAKPVPQLLDDPDPSGREAARHRDARADARLETMDLGEHRPVTSRTRGTPEQAGLPDGPHELRHDAADLHVQIDLHARGARKREHGLERRRAGQAARVVVHDEHAVGPTPDVDLDRIRPTSDRARERLEGVLATGARVAAVRDTQECAALVQG